MDDEFAAERDELVQLFAGMSDPELVDAYYETEHDLIFSSPTYAEQLGDKAALFRSMSWAKELAQQTQHESAELERYHALYTLASQALLKEIQLRKLSIIPPAAEGDEDDVPLEITLDGNESWQDGYHIELRIRGLAAVPQMRDRALLLARDLIARKVAQAFIETGEGEALDLREIPVSSSQYPPPKGGYDDPIGGVHVRLGPMPTPWSRPWRRRITDYTDWPVVGERLEPVWDFSQDHIHRPLTHLVDRTPVLRRQRSRWQILRQERFHTVGRYDDFYCSMRRPDEYARERMDWARLWRLLRKAN
jgi:hypothetical protein